MLMPLWILSQNTGLTPEQESRVLEVFTPEKIIDVSKAIDNEKRQYVIILQLQSKIDSLKALAAEKDIIISDFKNEIVSLNKDLERVNNEENDVADAQLKNAKKPFLGLHLTTRVYSQKFQTDKLSLQTNLYYKLEKLTLGISFWGQHEPVLDTFEHNFYYGPYIEYKLF